MLILKLRWNNSRGTWFLEQEGAQELPCKRKTVNIPIVVKFRKGTYLFQKELVFLDLHILFTFFFNSLQYQLLCKGLGDGLRSTEIDSANWSTYLYPLTVYSIKTNLSSIPLNYPFDLTICQLPACHVINHITHKPWKCCSSTEFNKLTHTKIWKTTSTKNI